VEVPKGLEDVGQFLPLVVVSGRLTPGVDDPGDLQHLKGDLVLCRVLLILPVLPVVAFLVVVVLPFALAFALAFALILALALACNCLPLAISNCKKGVCVCV